MTSLPSLAIVAGSAMLMQLHSMAFWLGQVGAAGVAWSLMLEAAALWLWWQRRWALAVLASGLLIAGPFYQLSAPALDALRATEAAGRMATIEQAEIAQLEASLGRFEANSAARLGWAERIDRTQAELREARARLRAQVEAQAQGADWRALAVVGMQGLALLVVMVTQVLAVTCLRPVAVPLPAAPAPEPAAPELPEEVPFFERAHEDPDALAVHVADLVEADRKARRESQAALARRLGVRPADVSMLLNHEERRNAGRETVSTAVLRKLADHYDNEKESRNE